MESYAHEGFPPKAGVYAVREGPIIAQNVAAMINGEPLTEYVPQRGFLSLMMTGDGSAFGSKFGLTFVGKWVWDMKDFIDVGFMKLFDPYMLFKDFKQKGLEAEPLDNNEMFDDAKSDLESKIGEMRKAVEVMDPKEALEKL